MTMSKQESEREIVIPRLREALIRYKQMEGNFTTDSAIEIINSMLSDYAKSGTLRPSQRSFALDLIKNSFRRRMQ